MEHVLECIDIMKHTDSKLLSMWLADGTNYPGTDSFRERHNRLVEFFKEIASHMDDDMKMLIEYKFFEPAFYHTDLGDWGVANLVAQKVGEKAKVLVDLGHHPLGTNIEFIVALLLNEGMLGGFHFNDKKYADDDLTSGSIAPYQLFLIFNEISDYEAEKSNIAPIAYMVDQSHNLKHKLVAMVQTIENIQIAFAQSLLVDRKSLAEARKNYDIVKAELILKDAFLTDVRPLLAEVRKELGKNPDIISECINSEYMKKVEGRGEI
jgi:L-rhamnose isomerase/sugar isomerase